MPALPVRCAPRRRARSHAAGRSSLPVEWGLAGDPDVHSVLDAAMRACASVDLVIHAPRNSADPWKHAVQADIADCMGRHLVFRTAGDVQSLGMADIHAVRVAYPSVAATVRPRHTIRTITGSTSPLSRWTASNHRFGGGSSCPPGLCSRSFMACCRPRWAGPTATWTCSGLMTRGGHAVRTGRFPTTPTKERTHRAPCRPRRAW